MKREEIYQSLCNKRSDINQHLPTLKKYSEECNHVTEFGVRSVVSTWALLCGNPQTLISYDIKHPSKFKGDIDLVYALSGGTNFKFVLANVLEVDIEPTDLLFIDTWHTYRQLSLELAKHSKNVGRYIILHDTSTFGETGEDKGEGILKALNEFLFKNKDWSIKEVYTNNNGLTIIERNGR